MLMTVLGGGEDKVYFPPNIQTLRHGYRRVRKDESLLEDWIRRTEQQHVEIMEVCSLFTILTTSDSSFFSTPPHALVGKRQTMTHAQRSFRTLVLDGKPRQLSIPSSKAAAKCVTII